MRRLESNLPSPTYSWRVDLRDPAFWETPPPKRFVVAFDPGPHTGVAVVLDGLFDDPDDENHLVRGIMVAHSTLTADPDEGPASLYRAIASEMEDCYSSNPPIVVVEGYHSAKAVGRDGLETLRLIGWIYGFALCGESPVFFQSPSVKRPFLANAANFYHPKTSHEQDAIAHALAYLAFHPAPDSPSDSPEGGYHV